MQKKSFLTPLGLVHQYNFHQNHTAVLQFSYREIFIFLNIPGKDFTGSFRFSFKSLFQYFRGGRGGLKRIPLFLSHIFL